MIGMKKIYIRTFGCPLNKFDTLVMEGYLRREGYAIADSPLHSDMIIVNTCGVKKQTEDKIIDYLKKINRVFPKKKLIVVGCLPLINFERLSRQTRYDAILGPSPGEKIVDAVRSVVKNKFFSFLYSSYYKDIAVKLPVMNNKISFPVGVSSGCLDQCSFCGTKHARGTVKSLSMKKIRSIIMYAVKNNVKEIYLTSSDLGAYGFDLLPRKNMIDLLRMINDIKGDFIVRIGMANPRWIYKWIDDLIELFTTSSRFYFFLHIPVQSGSDKMLKIMRRGHGVMEYFESVKRLRKEVDPRFSISTDIIVGHPGEADEDFELTIDLVRESKPDYVNISKFFPRPKTPAKYMKKLPTDLIKRRSKILSEIVDDILFERNKLWIGWRGSVLIDEFGKDGTFMGRNYAYKIIVVEGKNLMGRVMDVKVINTKITWLKAKVFSESSSFLFSKRFSEQIS